MAFCHGDGEPTSGPPGCCWINGIVCPLRWEVRDVGGDDHVFDANGVDLGTVDQLLRTYTNNGAARRNIAKHFVGVRWLCRAALELTGEIILDSSDPLHDIVEGGTVVMDDTQRDAFDARWLAHPDYVAIVAPQWRQIEIDAGLPAGTLDCATWVGTGTNQCCYAEDASTNAAGVARLDGAAVTIRGAKVA